MPIHRFLCRTAAAALLAATAPAHATASIDDYVAARSSFNTNDGDWLSGSELQTAGAGTFAITNSYYSYADLSTNFGAMSGSASGTPPSPQRGGSVWNTQVLKAQATGVFQDSFLLSASTLAVGTPVTLLLTVTLDGTIARSAVNSALPALPRVYAGWGLWRDSPLAAAQLFTSSGSVATAQWSTVVGANVDLVGLLDVSLMGLISGQDSQQSESASGIAHYYLDVLTAGVSATSASGFNYASPVPEPAPAAMLVAGLAAWGLLIGRRAAPSR
jgi:hypothetical protein